MRVFRILVVYPLLLLGIAYMLGQWWVLKPLTLPASASAEAPLVFEIPPGSSARQSAQRIADAGVDVMPDLLFAWFRLSGDSREIKAGVYEIAPGTTPRQLLGKLVRGEQALRNAQIIEGLTARQAIDALRESPDLTNDLKDLSLERKPLLDEAEFQLAERGNALRPQSVDIAGAQQHVVQPCAAEAGRQPAGEGKPLLYAGGFVGSAAGEPFGRCLCSEIDQDGRRFGEEQSAVFQDRDRASRIERQQLRTAMLEARVEIHRTQLQLGAGQRRHQARLVAAR